MDNKYGKFLHLPSVGTYQRPFCPASADGFNILDSYLGVIRAGRRLTIIIILIPITIMNEDFVLVVRILRDVLDLCHFFDFAVTVAVIGQRKCLSLHIKTYEVCTGELEMYISCLDLHVNIYDACKGSDKDRSDKD